MPTKPPHPCNRPGCPALVTAGGYCQEHTTDQIRPDYRETSAARGYDSKWRKFRVWFLRANPFCVDCGAADRLEIHHIKKLADNPERRLDPENCLTLCRTCHQKRTGRGE